jgi:hypothetical protein
MRQEQSVKRNAFSPCRFPCHRASPKVGFHGLKTGANIRLFWKSMASWAKICIFAARKTTQLGYDDICIE